MAQPPDFCGFKLFFDRNFIVLVGKGGDWAHTGVAKCFVPPGFPNDGPAPHGTIREYGEKKNETIKNPAFAGFLIFLVFKFNINAF